MNLHFIFFLCFHFVRSSSLVVPSSLEGDDDSFPYDTSILWNEKPNRRVTFAPSCSSSSPSSVVELVAREEDLPLIPQRITVDWIENEMIPTFKRGHMLPINLIKHIISEAREYFSFDSTIHDVNVPVGGKIVIVGDIHGQFESTLGIFEDFGYPRPDCVYLFNGDVVDRGDKSLECILMVFAYKIALFESFFVTRGNHESRSVSRGSFYDECLGRLSEYPEAFDNFHTAFESLPYGYVVRDKIFVTHGGLCPGMDLKVLRVLMRHHFTYENTFEFYSMLWNDPCEDTVPVNSEGLAPSSRGEACCLFHPNVTIDFLARSNLCLLVRSHQSIREGARFSQGKHCLTIFSAPNYRGGNNRGAVLIVTADSMKIEMMR